MATTFFQEQTDQSEVKANIVAKYFVAWAKVTLGKGRRVFVNSMSDLVHEDVPLAFIKDVFAVMAETPRHTYQVLTKRADRMLELSPELCWPENVWMRVSVENDDYLGRADRLRRTAARVKFLSLEPLLGPLVPGLCLDGIHWVIVGGESGPGARPIDAAWVRAIRDVCIDQGVVFHFKQWGGPVKSRTGRELDGREWDEQPGLSEFLCPGRLSFTV